MRRDRPRSPSASCSTPSTTPWPTPTARTARDHVVHHPLQTVDERNFVPGGSVAASRSASTCSTSPRRARGAGRPAGQHPPPLAAPPDTDQLDLEDLASTLEHPVRAFIRTRLGATLPGDEPQLDDRLPLELGGLRPLGRRRPAAAGRARRHRRSTTPPRPSDVAATCRRPPSAAPPSSRSARRSSRCSPRRRGTWSSLRRASTSRSRWTTGGCSPARSTVCAATSWSAPCSPRWGPSTACARGCSCSRWPPPSRTARSRR